MEKMTNDQARQVLFLVEKLGDDMWACFCVAMDETQGDVVQSIEIAKRATSKPDDPDKVSRFSDSKDCGHDEDGDFSLDNTCASGGSSENIKEFRLKNGHKISSDHLDILKIIGNNRGPMNSDAIRRSFDKSSFKDIRQAYGTVTQPAKELIHSGLLEKSGTIEGKMSGPGYSYAGPGSSRPDKVEKDDPRRDVYDLTDKGHELVSKWLGQETRKEKSPEPKEEAYAPDRKETEEMVQLTRNTISRIEKKIELYKKEKRPILLKEQFKSLERAKENLRHYENQLKSNFSRSRFDFHEGSDDIPSTKKSLTAEDVGKILASQYKKVTKKGYITSPEKEISKWVTSDKFILVRNIPLWSLRVYADIKDSDHSHSTGPIIIDRFKGSEDHRFGAFGSLETSAVVDGKHRVADALEAGKETLDAYVGNDIKEELLNHIREFSSKRDRFVDALSNYYGESK